MNVLIETDLPMLRASAYRILGNPFDADEAIQNALLKSWQKLGSFRNEAKLSSWVYRVTLNECFAMLRKRRAEKKVMLRFADEQAAGTDTAPQEGRLEMLRLAIAGLPELYRDAISTGYLSNLSGEEAAAKLECSVNTLHQRIHKAKQLLKISMGKE